MKPHHTSRRSGGRVESHRSAFPLITSSFGKESHSGIKSILTALTIFVEKPKQEDKQ
jgi:hypothetical protein